jgi:hypothetical protein
MNSPSRSAIEFRFCHMVPRTAGLGQYQRFRVVAAGRLEGSFAGESVPIAYAIAGPRK